jgi:putative membrane protein
MKRLSVLLGLAGLFCGTALIGWFGFGRILGATASVGVAGFAVVCAWQLVLFATLGLCWFVLLPAAGAWRLWVAVWGRMVRDAAGGLLPLSLVGGFVLGSRAVTLHGVAWPAAAASTVVDLTAEFVAQIGLVLIGLVLLARRAPGAAPILPVGVGLVVAVAAGLAFFWAQGRGGAPLMRLSRRVLGGAFPGVDAHLAAVHASLAGIYAAPWRVALCTALHLVAWFGTGFASFLAFRLLGAHIGFADALGIEALLHAVLAGAILVPGYAGVQEAAYAGVGTLFGQTPELALAVSLLRRARDIALGVPILVGWQLVEWRRKKAVLF